MNTLEAIVTLLPLAAGGWAAWALPRWAGEGRHRRPPAPQDGDWTTAEGLPSRPYRDLRHV